jgi:hypothetical protein
VEDVFAKKFSGAGEDLDRIDGPMSACGRFDGRYWGKSGSLLLA